jgi:hypothetical protein
MLENNIVAKYEVKGTHARDFQFIFPIFLASFNNRQGQGPECQMFFKFKCKILVNIRIFAFSALSPKTHRFTPSFGEKASFPSTFSKKMLRFPPRFWRKCCISLRVFGENALFHSTYSPKMHNSSFSLNTLYTAESAQFYFTFSPTTIWLTPRFHQKREV